MRKKFKRNLMILLGAVLILSVSVWSYVERNMLGDVRHVRRQSDVSAIYTPAEIEAAMDTAIRHFRAEFGGSRLLEIIYDEEKSLLQSDEWAAQYAADQAIVLYSAFEVRSEDNWTTGLEPGETYRGWSWILVRNENCPWQLKTWGYG